MILNEEFLNMVYGGYTSSRRPVSVVYTKDFASREEAKLVEAKLKKWSAKKKMALAKGDWEEISKLGRKKFKK